jgi:hypothetical protein
MINMTDSSILQKSYEYLFKRAIKTIKRYNKEHGDFSTNGTLWVENQQDYGMFVLIVCNDLGLIEHIKSEVVKRRKFFKDGDDINA